MVPLGKFLVNGLMNLIKEGKLSILPKEASSQLIDRMCPLFFPTLKLNPCARLANYSLINKFIVTSSHQYDSNGCIRAADVIVVSTPSNVGRLRRTLMQAT